MSEKVLGFQKKEIEKMLSVFLSQYSRYLPEWNDSVSLIEIENESDKLTKEFIKEELKHYKLVPVVSIEETHNAIDWVIERERENMIKRPIETSGCHIDVVEALETLRGKIKEASK